MAFSHPKLHILLHNMQTEDNEQSGECFARPMAEENVASASRIDMLPTELFENLLRFVSRFPNSSKGQSHIVLGDMMELLAVHGEFGSYLKSRFTRLCISPTKNCAEEKECFKWSDCHGPHLWTNSIDVAHKYVLAGGGQSLETLVVGIGADLYGRKGVVDDFVQNCPNVKALSIAENGTTWVQKFGNQIEKLEVRLFFTQDLAIHIPNLSELNLFLCNANIPAGFWQSIGYSLEKLTVKRLSNAVELKKIMRYCGGLRSISLGDGDGEYAAATVSLLTSYGDNLEFAYLSGMNEGQVKAVVDACPNARFDLVNFQGRFSSAEVDLIAPKLDYMPSADYPPFGGNDDEWRYLWNKCINIRELYILVKEVTKVQQIFSTPKKHLKVLRLGFLPNSDTEDVEKVMKACVEGTLCVEKFIYYGPKFYGDGSNKFLETNRNTLKSVRIEMIQYGSSEELDELLDLLFELPALEELFFNCAMPDDKLKTLKKRGIYWKYDSFAPDIPGDLY